MLHKSRFLLQRHLVIFGLNENCFQILIQTIVGAILYTVLGSTSINSSFSDHLGGQADHTHHKNKFGPQNTVNPKKMIFRCFQVIPFCSGHVLENLQRIPSIIIWSQSTGLNHIELISGDFSINLELLAAGIVALVTGRYDHPSTLILCVLFDIVDC